jgi:O-antigen ligase
MEMKIRNIGIDQLQLVSLAVITFLLPIAPKAVPYGVASLGLISIFNLLARRIRFQMNLAGLLFILFFLLHLSGLLFSDNMDKGWFEIELKLSLLLFPFLFVGIKPSKAMMIFAAQGFVLGVFLADTISFGRLFWEIYVSSEWLEDYWPYAFSIFMHPSYFAIYNVFALSSYVFLRIANKEHLKSRWIFLIDFVLVLIVISSVILSKSKIGLIAMILVGLIVLGWYINLFRQKWKPLLAVVLMLTPLFYFAEHSSYLSGRWKVFNEYREIPEINPNSKESTVNRIMIYESASEIIEAQPWYGMGTGDFQDVLNDRYACKEYAYPLKRSYNAHNLFLQVFISLGFPGVILLTLILIHQILLSARTRNMLHFLFILLFVLLSLTESSLNMQVGVVFFSFFICVFSRSSAILSADDR